MAKSVFLHQNQRGQFNQPNLASFNHRNVGNTMQSQQPPDDFRSHYLMPKISDLFDRNGLSGTGRIFLRPNVTRSKYQDLNQYLDIHYRLLREDFLDPLRQSIGKFCTAAAKTEQQVPDAMQAKNLHFYRNCRVVKDSFLLSQSVPDRPDYWRRYSIDFDAPIGINWETNKRLIYGSLVALWNAAERLVLLAVVTRSDPEELEKGWITLSFDTEPPAGFQGLVYTMLECPVFYEPYRVVMEAYQHMDHSNFPLSPYILGWTKAAGVPDYLKTKSAHYRLTLADGTVETIKDVMTLNSWPSAEKIGVNAIQRQALHAAMTRQVALIQGPPGTGKSYIGRKIVATLLDNQHLWQGDNNNNSYLKDLMEPGKMGQFWDDHGQDWNDTRCPIVVICLTNQALDQFLEGVLDRTERIIRLGSQSKSSLLEPFLMSNTKDSIYHQRRSYTETNFFFYSSHMKTLARNIQDLQDDIISLSKKILRPTNPSIVLNATEAAEEAVLRLKYECMVSDYKARIAEYNYVKAQSEEALCRNVDVIGMTTTGAARRRHLLSLLRPKIVVVEEAAQVLEPHIVASLTTGCQHLIMIGDHQQLRPSCNVHLMAFKYRMDVSLFERMVGLGFPTVTLQVQHRMRADVARLIVPSVYRQLLNHPSTDQYPPVPSMGGRNVFFLDHRGKEQREDGGCSYYNPTEADFVLRLAHFLIEQDVHQERITILTAYGAQQRYIEDRRRQLFKLRSLDQVHITTIDNYQGEENDIIILSLVRNNDVKSVGFLRTPNRVCVALSRAKHGLFLLGNMNMLAGSGSPLWRHVQTVLGKNGQLGDYLTLSCDRHPQQIVKVKQPTDFPLGGFVCKHECGGPLVVCGHPCPLPCSNGCRHLASTCKKTVPKALECGHTIQMLCRSPMTPRCNSFKCEQLLPCKHPCPAKCSDPCDPALCEVIVDLHDSPPLDCKHPVRGPCGLLLKPPSDRPSSLMDQSLCPAPCSKVLSCGHLCPSKCGQCTSLGVHGMCRNPCNRKLICNHICQSLCAQSCRPCQLPCKLRCAHQTCSNVCGSPCSPCPSDGCTWACPHLKCDPHPCQILCNRKPCDLPCSKLLACRHRCPGLCGELCPPPSGCPECNRTPGGQLMVYLPDCNHCVTVEEMDRDSAEAVLQGPPSCPRCKEPLTATWGRYGDRVKNYYLDVCGAVSAYERDWKMVMERSLESLLERNAPNKKTIEFLRSALRGKNADARYQLYWRIVRLCLISGFKDQLDKKKKNKTELLDLETRCDDLGDALLLHSERPEQVLLQWRRLHSINQQPDNANLSLLHRRLSLELGLDWTKCSLCKSVHVGSSCPNDPCLHLQHLSIE